MTIEENWITIMATLCANAARLNEIVCGYDKQHPDTTDLVAFEESSVWQNLWYRYGADTMSKVQREMYRIYHTLPI